MELQNVCAPALANWQDFFTSFNGWVGNLVHNRIIFDKAYDDCFLARQQGP
jgi:hypothetical protein